MIQLPSDHATLLRDYVKTAVTHLLNSKLFSAINVLGLAVGLACFTLIALFVRHELSYDRYHTNAERIYRIAHDYHAPDGGSPGLSARTSPQVAPLFEREFAQVERAARLRSWRVPVSRDDTLFYAEAAFADSALFEIFEFEWLSGDGAGALVEPWTVVLTQSAAHRYFGTGDAMGRVLTFEGRFPATVTGVVRDLPPNTHLSFDLLVSMPSAPAAVGVRALDNWYATFYHTYLVLEEGGDVSDIGSQTAAFLERHVGEGTTDYWGLTPEPLTGIHLHSRRQDELKTPGSIMMVYAFSAIAAFILIIACINFMNLATARAAERANEIGIRKAIGAERGQLAAQFLGESILLAVIATVLSAAFVELALPSFNAFIGQALTLDYLSDPIIVPTLGGLALLVGLVSGSYPALYLSAFSAARVLGGNLTRGRSATRFRGALVVLQFAISITLLIATGTVYSQILFARNIELGYDKEQMVVLDTSGREGLGRQWDALKRELLAHPEITHVTASNVVPGNAVEAAYFVNVEGVLAPRTLRTMLVDFEFLETYGIDLTAGRGLSGALATDQTRSTAPDPPGAGGAYVLNELGARQLGWTPEQAIGKWIEITCCGFRRAPVVGVVEDVYFDSVENPIEATVYAVPPEPDTAVHSETRLGLRQASLRITGDRIPETVDYIDATWARFKPDEPVLRRFLDQDFDALYRSQEGQVRLLTVFSSLAIFVACLGLFGLASFATERRAKEIGVRKAMGGTVLDIVRLFTSEFSNLVVVANVIAWPIAYFAMRRWLEGFAYRIEISPVLFFGSGILALAVALTTVGIVAARAASAKPIQSLRYE